MNLIYYVQPYGFFAVSLKRDGRAPLGVAGVFAFMFELPTQPLSLLHRAPSKTCTIAIAVGVTTTIISGGLLRMTYCHLKGPATPRHVIPDQSWTPEASVAFAARGWHLVTARLLGVKSVALVVADARPAHMSPCITGFRWGAWVGPDRPVSLALLYKRRTY